MATTSAPPPPPSLLLFNGLLILLFLSIPFFALRLLFILPPLRPAALSRKRPGSAPSPSPQDPSNAPTRLLVVLGSGGHTAEMMAMLGKLDKGTFAQSWSHRTYVVSEGDALSAERAREWEEGLAREVEGAKKTDAGAGPGANGTAAAASEPEKVHLLRARSGRYDVRIVPRARRIHQSLLTTPLSALRCLLACFSILRSPSPTASDPCPPPQPDQHFYPDLILTNGPGTAVVVILTALLLRFFDFGDAKCTSRMRTVYVESWARVKKLSLSGRLLVKVVDRFLVQWETLVERTAGRGEYLGVLV